MRVIPTYIHGVFDYIVGVALLVAPELFGFAGVGGAAEWVPRALGVLILLQAISTDYEVGIFRAISMRTHLMMDYIVGIFLFLSPWLFGFNNLPDNAWWPHVVVGLVILALALLTERSPRRAVTGPTATQTMRDEDRVERVHHP